MSNLRLKNNASILATTTDDWSDVLELAEDFGWRPEQTRSLYVADVGLRVTAHDSVNLARALDDLAEHILNNEPDIDEPRRKRILGDLNRIIRFCRDGQFRIC